MADQLLELRDGTEITQEQIGLLHKRVEELKLSKATLLAENKIYEQFISRLDPQDLVAQDSTEGQRTTGNSQLEGGGAGRRRRSRLNTSDRPQSLTSQQKLCVAQREVTELQHELKKLRKKYESTRDSQKESLEEAELCLSEMRKMKNGPERRASKLVKDHIREEDKIKASLLRTLTLKNQALKDQEKKLQKQLQQKQQLELEDYEKLLLPSTQVFTSCQPSDEDLRELQMKSFKAQRLLNSHKEKLQNVIEECEGLDAVIGRKKKMLATFEKEIRRVEEECLKTEARNKRIQHLLEDYGPGPDPTQYILLKERNKKLQKSVRTRERKIEIAELALRLKPKLQHKQSVNVPLENGAAAGAQSDQGHIPVNSQQN